MKRGSCTTFGPCCRCSSTSPVSTANAEASVYRVSHIDGPIAEGTFPGGAFDGGVQLVEDHGRWRPGQVRRYWRGEGRRSTRNSRLRRDIGELQKKGLGFL
jgi:hypothetical protein